MITVPAAVGLLFWPGAASEDNSEDNSEDEDSTVDSIPDALFWRGLRAAADLRSGGGEAGGRAEIRRPFQVHHDHDAPQDARGNFLRSKEIVVSHRFDQRKALEFAQKKENSARTTEDRFGEGAVDSGSLNP
jgi:hypothetical protein